MASLRSPRHFCLACANAIDEARLRSLGVVKTTLFGFCTPACENNFAVRLSSAPRLELLREQRELLARIQTQILEGKKVAQLEMVDRDNLHELAQKRLVILHGRLGAAPTVRGDISYICSRVTQGDLEDRKMEQRGEHELDAMVHGDPHWS